MTETNWMPPRYFKWLVILAIVLHFTLPIYKAIEPPVSYIGVAAIVFAIYLNFAASRSFISADTSIKPYHTPNSLVIQGIYRWTRNPMYLGLVLFLLGLTLLMGSLSPFITPILMFAVLDRRFIPHEERVLAEAFGNQYEAYKLQVRRWL